MSPGPLVRVLWLSSCLLLAVCLLSPCQAKPYHVAKKPRFQESFPESPFAPPAFYDSDDDDYGFKDSGWMGWSPDKHPKSETSPDKLNGLQEKDAKLVNEEKAVDDKYDEAKKEEQPQQETGNETPEKPAEPKLLSDPCKRVFCKYGRVCQVDKTGLSAQCVCAGTDFCKGHSKQVCGTDSVLYPSHCELHRMACVNGVHIGVDHTGDKCATNEEDVEPSIYNIEVTKEKVNPDQPKDESRNDLISSDQTLEDEVVKEDTEVTKETEDNTLADENTEDPEEDPEEDVLDTELKTPCEELEYERLKNNLLQYHCARIGEMDCTTDPAKKQFVANIMFNYYDLNGDQQLTEEELSEIERRDHLEKLSRFCRLPNFLTFNDHEGDGNISIGEFYSAFKIPTVVLDDSLKVFTSTVTSGNSVELKCDIKGAKEIIWKRNGATLEELISDDIEVFEDGSLYLKHIGLHHIGNYSCQDKFEPGILQTHVLKVQTPPRVRVSPSTQFHVSGSSVTLKCHADGVPEPEMSWEMNEAPLTLDTDKNHYILRNNNATLEIHQATYTKDTGAYKCKGKNSAGQSQDIATVFIENSQAPQYSSGGALSEVFLVFHERGYTVYEPNHCNIEHQVASSFSTFKYMPDYGDSLSRLCEGDVCNWGQAVNVQNKYIYISQPDLHRIVVIEIMDRSNPIEIIQTDKFPVKLQYIDHLDQVWVLCWNQEDDSGAKTAVVIREASRAMHHHIVHTQPIGIKFDVINDFFLPPTNDLLHKFDYGYVVHRDQQGLYKLDLRAMQYVKYIELVDYSCVPKSVAFIPMGGQVIIHCTSPEGFPDKSTRIILDYVTDKVLDHSALGGEPFLSPDARHLVTVETDGNTISVSRLRDDGKMEHVFDEYTNLHISDVTFFPSDRGHGYDFYASANNKNDVLFIDLETGKVQMIEGVGLAEEADPVRPWSHHNRAIISGGVFGGYLMTPSRDSVVVIDGQRRQVQCEWQNIQHGSVIVWVDPMHL